MALATAVITFDLANALGVAHHKGTSVTATTNIDGDVVVDTLGNEIRIGSGRGTVAADGTGSISVWIPGTGSNPASWQTSFIVRYRDPLEPGGHATRTFGPFTITASADLADLIEEQEIPAAYLTTVTAQLDAYVTEAEAARDATVDISGISTSDGVVEALVKNTGGAGPLTSAALSATYARKWIVDVKGDHAAAGNGVADDAAAFTAAIATGAKHIHVPPGTYIVNGLTLNQAGQTLLLSPGATLKAKAGGAQTLVTITAAGAGIVATGPQVFIDGNGVGAAAGSAVYVNNADDASVLDCIFINCAGMGVNAQGTRPTVEGTFINCGSVSVYVKPPTSGADLMTPNLRRIVVRNINDVGGVKIDGNGAAKVRRAKLDSIDVTLPTNATVGICVELFGGCVGGTIDGLTTSGGVMGLSLSEASEITVNGPYVYAATQIGIELAASTGCTLNGPVVDGAGVTQDGIQGSQPTHGQHTITAPVIKNLLAATGRGIYLIGTAAGNGAARDTVITSPNIAAVKPLLIAHGFGFVLNGGNLRAAAGATAAVEMDTCTDSIIAGVLAHGFSGALLNIYGGPMTNILLGPNLLSGGTPTQMINGPLGAGSRTV